VPPRCHPVITLDIDLGEALDDSHGEFPWVAAPMFGKTEDFCDYKRRLVSYLRTINPMYPRFLDGPPPHDANTNGLYIKFQHRVFYLLGLPTAKHPLASLALADVEQDPHLSSRLSPGSHAWRALNSMFDPRGMRRTRRLLQKLM
jgi:hypothetical protein